MNSIDAQHTLKLPGLHCPLCGVWALAGVAYPTVDPSTFPVGLLPTSGSPLSIDAFSALSNDLVSKVGTGRTISPGSDFGQLNGKARGEFAEFGWLNPWTVLVREAVVSLFEQVGVQLNTALAQLKFTGGTKHQLVEIEALPTLKLARSVEREVCSVCGRIVVKRNAERLIDADTFDESIALQRIAELPTVLIANRAFAQVVRDQNLRDITLAPVKGE